MSGWVDIHCHALPGVDDGAEDVEMGLDMMRRSRAEGVDDVILTPHFRPEEGAQRAAALRAAFEPFAEAVARAGIAVRVHLGAEVGFRFGLGQLLADEEVTRLVGGPYALVDLPPGPLSPGLEEAFFAARTSGIRPILAHPERHRLLAASRERLAGLRDQELLLQVDAGSLRGRFGSRARGAAIALVEAGQVDLVASDGHDLERRPPALRSAYDQVVSLAGEAEARRLFAENPRRVLLGEPLQPAPSRPPEAARRRRIQWPWRRRAGSERHR